MEGNSHELAFNAVLAVRPKGCEKADLVVAGIEWKSNRGADTSHWLDSTILLPPLLT